MKLSLVFLIFVCISFSSFCKKSRFLAVDNKDDQLALNVGRRLTKNINTHQKDLSNILFQKCKDSGEAYGASYLITREHLQHQFTAYNLTWVNCEMGSFIMMNGKANPDKSVNGSLLQSVDVLDFSVVHLSTYERLLRRWSKSVSSDAASRSGNIDPIIQSATLLRQRAMTLRNISAPMTHPAFNRTVVVMPFLGIDMGAGHSKLSNRFQYLSACFWSFYAVYPHVVAAVKHEKDRDFAMNMSGLPFYDVILITDLPKSASLPVATVQATKNRMMNGTWAHFDYMFFTESDQILMMRVPDDIYAYLDKYPRHLMIPHRLMAYPSSILKLHHKRNGSSLQPFDWMDLSCCLPRQHCTERKNWVHVSNESALPVVNIYGIQVPLGNSNFHAETYRACALTTSSGPNYMCP